MKTHTQTFIDVFRGLTPSKIVGATHDNNPVILALCAAGALRFDPPQVLALYLIARESGNFNVNVRGLQHLLKTYAKMVSVWVVLIA